MTFDLYAGWPFWGLDSAGLPDGECGIAKIYKNKDVHTNHFNSEAGREKQQKGL